MQHLALLHRPGLDRKAYQIFHIELVVLRLPLAVTLDAELLADQFGGPFGRIQILERRQRAAYAPTFETG